MMRMRLQNPGRAAVLIAALFQVLACSPQAGPEEVLPKRITLSETELSLGIGETFTLEAVLLPAEVSDRTVTWSSTNPARVTVTPGGLVTAVSQGTAYVIAEAANALRASCLVTVRASSVSYKVSILSGDNPIEGTVYGYPGMQLQLSAVTDDGGSHSFRWNATGENIAVRDGGLVEFGLGSASAAESYAWYSESSVNVVSEDGAGAGVVAVTSVADQFGFGDKTVSVNAHVPLAMGKSAEITLYWFDGTDLSAIPREAVILKPVDTSILTASGNKLVSTGVTGRSDVNVTLAGKDVKLCSVTVAQESGGGDSDVEHYVEENPEW